MILDAHIYIKAAIVVKYFVFKIIPPKLLLCVETIISINIIIKQIHSRYKSNPRAGYGSAVFLRPFRHQHDPATSNYVVF